MSIQIGKFSINKFWSDTPILLKYVLIISIVLGVTYFFVKEKYYNSQLDELKRTGQGITVTYQLVQRLEDYKTTQDNYNKEFSKGLKDVYSLITELKDNTDSKFSLILTSNSKNKDLIVDKLEMLNKSFDKISNAYKPAELPPANNTNDNTSTTQPTNTKYNINGKLRD
jgi:hypothetical protein